MSAEATKTQIKQTVLRLLQTKSISEINVTAVARETHISRNTFYTYYDSTYGVLDDIMDDFFRDCRKATERYVGVPFHDKYFNYPHPAILAALCYLLEPHMRELIITLNNPRLSSSLFAYRCKKLIKEMFYDKAVTEGYIKAADHLTELYMVAGHYELFVYAAANGDQQSDLEELAVKIYRLMFGPIRWTGR